MGVVVVCGSDEICVGVAVVCNRGNMSWCGGCVWQ